MKPYDTMENRLPSGQHIQAFRVARRIQRCGEAPICEGFTASGTLNSPQLCPLSHPSGVVT